MSSAPVVIVTHEKTLADAIRASLEAAGHNVEIINSSEAITTDGDRVLPRDLIILDAGPATPDAPDLDTWPQYNGQTSVPIIALVDQIEDGLFYLNAGADDFLVKPFGLPELLARVRACLRRLPRSNQNVFRAVGLELDPDCRCIVSAGREIHLSPTEFRLLELLIHKPEYVHSRRELIDALGNRKDQIDPRTIDVYIGRLRKSLSNSLTTIKTVHGMGYALRIDPTDR